MDVPQCNGSLYREFDTLPDYSCSVEAAGLLFMKREFDLPQLQSRKRRWKLIAAELRGTCLTLRNGKHAVTVSMQAGDVGLASDYYRRSDVLRVRAEGRQFILATQSLASLISWYGKFLESIAISLDLDSRKEPRMYTTPRKQSIYKQVSFWGRFDLLCIRTWQKLWKQHEYPDPRDEGTEPEAINPVTSDDKFKDTYCIATDIHAQQQKTLRFAYRCARVLPYDSK